LLKVLSRPRVVTQNNVQAVVKQGTKIPIMTASTIGAPATATYVDAFLRLTVTPQITSEERSSSTWTWKTLCPILATKTLPETPP